MFLVVLVGSGIGALVANHDQQNISSFFGPKLDGLYKGENTRIPITLEIRENDATLKVSDYTVEAKLERFGDTLKFTQQRLYKNGYASNDISAGDSEVELAKIGDSGQSITITSEGVPVKLVKQ